MRFSLLFFLLVSLFNCSTRAGAQDVGSTAPSLNLDGMPGPFNLAEMRGKVVYLDFWASWCAPCRQSFPWMEQLQARYAQDGLRVVAVNVDQKRADAMKFLQNRPLEFTVAWSPDGLAPKAYSVKAMPTSVLISRDGRILYIHRGFRPEDTAALERNVQQALQAKE